MRGNFVSANGYTTWVPQKCPNQFFPSSTSDCSQPSLPKESSSSESEHKQSALIVDDASDVTEMLSVLLSHAGYRDRVLMRT
jgi:hypothetical protein